MGRPAQPPPSCRPSGGKSSSKTRDPSVRQVASLWGLEGLQALRHQTDCPSESETSPSRTDVQGQMCGGELTIHFRREWLTLGDTLPIKSYKRTHTPKYAHVFGLVITLPVGRLQVRHMHPLQWPRKPSRSTGHSGNRGWPPVSANGAVSTHGEEALISAHCCFFSRLLGREAALGWTQKRFQRPPLDLVAIKYTPSNEAMFYRGLASALPPTSCEAESQVQQSPTCLDTAWGPLRYTNIQCAHRTGIWACVFDFEVWKWQLPRTTT